MILDNAQGADVVEKLNEVGELREMVKDLRVNIRYSFYHNPTLQYENSKDCH